MTIKRLGKVGKVGRVGKRGRIKPAGVLLGGVTGGGVEQLDLTPEPLKDVERRIGATRARRVWKLMQKGVVGTLPELVTYDWLERRTLEFQFQSGQLGGRRMRGGAVVDFVISGLAADGLYLWRIQGEYWHQGGEVEAKDEVQKARLRRLKIGGVPVVAVVDLWENDVYDRYPSIFLKAEAGMGLRGE